MGSETTVTFTPSADETDAGPPATSDAAADCMVVDSFPLPRETVAETRIDADVTTREMRLAFTPSARANAAAYADWSND
eukprot:591450-Prymnesium_polylepis.1